MDGTSWGELPSFGSNLQGFIYSASIDRCPLGTLVALEADFGGTWGPQGSTCHIHRVGAQPRPRASTCLLQAPGRTCHHSQEPALGDDLSPASQHTEEHLSLPVQLPSVTGLLMSNHGLCMLVPSLMRDFPTNSPGLAFCSFRGSFGPLLKYVY